ncbi:MAG TPA: SAM-dependent methyltransferase [Streptosporangiales bacterium]
MTEAEQATGVERDTPTAAGLYDAYLGGKNHSLAEKEAADKLRAAMPELEATAWANRAFHQRSAKWLASEAGIRQFIDLGAGLPTQRNTHEVVQEIAPDAHVVYVDFDRRTVELGSRLVADDPNTAYVESNLDQVDYVLDHPTLRGLIDLDKPVAILASAVFHFIADEQDPWGIAKRYMDRVASGSYLALNHVTADKQRPGPVQTIYSIYRSANTMIYFRNREQVEWFFEGLQMVRPYAGADPQVTFMGLWFCDDPIEADDDTGRWFYGGVAKKP